MHDLHVDLSADIHTHYYSTVCENKGRQTQSSFHPFLDFYNVHNKTVFNSKVKTIKPPKIKKEKLLAFCGLANSNKFYETLKENGFNVTSTKSFPDHYEYKNEDVDKLISEANKQNLKLITTEKDYYRIRCLGFKKINYVSINLKIIKNKSFEQDLLKYL